mgnify:CR=1 FL=1
MAPKKIDIEKISDFIINFCNEQGVSISPLKLQKLLYYIQAWHLVYFNQNPLFEDVPEAWVNGPVYRTIYDRFKDIGIYDNIPSNKAQNTKEIIEGLDLTTEQKEFLDSVLQHYAFMTHDKLVYLTHAEKPWNEARRGLSNFEYSNKDITHNLMYSYYSELSAKK